MSVYDRFPLSSLSVPFLPLFEQVSPAYLSCPGLLFALCRGQILTGPQGRLPSTVLLDSLQISGPLLYIGHFESGLKAYATTVSQYVPEPWTFIKPRALAVLLKRDCMAAMMRAMQLVYLQEEQKFCSKCGQQHVLDQYTPSQICPNCQYQVFPIISPAVLVLIERDNEILLGHNVHFPANLYSLIAGFCEAGEAAEDTVVREVYEETSLLVNNVRFMYSQNWPYPHSLMLGFRCTWVKGEICCQNEEISDAHWYTVDNLPVLPNKDSLARKMIDEWIKEQHAHPHIQTYQGDDLI